MIDLSLTTKEAVILDGTLSFIEILLAHEVPIAIKIKMIEETQSIEIKNVHEKLRAELDNWLQIQNMLSSAVIANPVDLVELPAPHIDFR